MGILMTDSYKALFLSHGGGPMPLLGDAGHREMVSCLKSIAVTNPAPEAIVVVSAHWEAGVPTITSGPNPGLIYDYYGFPQESYEIRYPCPGEPALAQKIHRLLNSAGIESELDEERGLDHGVFVPLTIMYPAANIPCVQLSLINSLDPSRHIEVGCALQTLSQDNVLIIGSGFSFHNMKAFFQSDTQESKSLNHAFEHWLLDTCRRTDISERERAQKLIDWADTPAARFCHPREEHLLPLHVCYGAGQAPCRESFELEIMGKKSSMYLW
jgi:aromatic ring-opening dioxygenase catalytic subunit (LigB family)